jgi:NTP pyrophosphatase (non-canonical NTP hydrolase)
LTEPSDTTNLTFSEYQAFTETVSLYPRYTENPSKFEKLLCLFPRLCGLFGEGGEFAEIIKKAIRDKDWEIDKIDEKHLKKELGDIQWYVADICNTMGWDLGEIAQMNVDKLQRRWDQNQIQGSGSDREESP